MLESEAWQATIQMINPIDGVAKVPCAANDRSNIMTLDQCLTTNSAS